MQLCAQAWANVIVDVPVAPAAEVPPLDIAPPVVAEPPVAATPPVALVPPVAEVPPAEVVPPVAEAPVPPVPPGVPPGVLPLPQAKTQEATPNTRTSDPTLFLNMQFLTENEVSRARRSSQDAFSGDQEDDRGVSKLRGLARLQATY